MQPYVLLWLRYTAFIVSCGRGEGRGARPAMGPLPRTAQRKGPLAGTLQWLRRVPHRLGWLHPCCTRGTSAATLLSVQGANAAICVGPARRCCTPWAWAASWQWWRSRCPPSKRTARSAFRWGGGRQPARASGCRVCGAALWQLCWHVGCCHQSRRFLAKHRTGRRPLPKWSCGALAPSHLGPFLPALSPQLPNPANFGFDYYWACWLAVLAYLPGA